MAAVYFCQLWSVYKRLLSTGGILDHHYLGLWFIPSVFAGQSAWRGGKQASEHPNCLPMNCHLPLLCMDLKLSTLVNIHESAVAQVCYLENTAAVAFLIAGDFLPMFRSDWLLITASDTNCTHSTCSQQYALWLCVF